VGIVGASLFTVDSPPQGDGGITDSLVPEADSPDSGSDFGVDAGAGSNDQQQKQQPPQHEQQQAQPRSSSSEETPHNLPVSNTLVNERQGKHQQDLESLLPQRDASRNPASSLFERASLLDAEATEALRSLPVPSAPEPASRPESPSRSSANTMSDIILRRTSANAMSDIILGRRGSRELLRSTVGTGKLPPTVAPQQAVQQVDQHVGQPLGNGSRRVASSSSPRRSRNTPSEDARSLPRRSAATTGDANMWQWNVSMEEVAPPGAAAASKARGSRVFAARRSSTPPPLPQKARQADCALCGRKESCPPEACFCEDCCRRMALIGSSTPATGGNRVASDEMSIESGPLSSASDPPQSPGQSWQSRSRSSSLAWSDAAPDGGHG